MTDVEAALRGAAAVAGAAVVVVTTAGAAAGASLRTVVSSAVTDGEAGESPVVVLTSELTAGDGTVTGASLLGLSRCGLRAAAEAVPVRGPAEPPVLSFDAEAPRPDRREGAVVLADPDEADDASVLEPADPVVSAKATGIEATADPTPRATASAPTRPT